MREIGITTHTIYLVNLQSNKKYLLHKQETKKTAYEVESTHASITAVLK